MVGNYVLGGGGFVLCLIDEVCEKCGFSYSVYSYFVLLVQLGLFQIGLQIKKEQIVEVLCVICVMLDKFLQEGLIVVELKVVKDNFVGGFVLCIDSNVKLLENFLVIGFYGLLLDYLDYWIECICVVSVQDVCVVFCKYVYLEELFIVIVGEVVE